MKLQNIILKEGKFYIKLENENTLEFTPTHIYCGKCRRRLSMKQYQTDNGTFTCANCGNSSLLHFKVPMELKSQ